MNDGCVKKTVGLEFLYRKGLRMLRISPFSRQNTITSTTTTQVKLPTSTDIFTTIHHNNG